MIKFWHKIPIESEEGDIMICPKCNKEIPDNSTFCNHCGEKITPPEPELEQTSLVDNTSVSSETNTPESTNNQTLSTKKKPIFIGLSIILVLITAFAVFFGYRHYKHKTFDFTAIDIVRYLDKSVIFMNDITDKGTVSEPSYGNTTVATWVARTGQDVPNKCITFNSDRNAKKYCEASKPSSHRLRYGNIVLELSQETEDDNFASYKDEMSDLEEIKDDKETKEAMKPDRPSSFADLNSFIADFRIMFSSFGEYCTFEESSVDDIPNDGIYLNTYTITSTKYNEQAELFISYDTNNKITDIIIFGGSGAFYSKEKAATDVTNLTYLATVNAALVSLDATIDYKSIDSHLIDEDYKTTVNNYAINLSFENKFYHTIINKASK